MVWIICALFISWKKKGDSKQQRPTIPDKELHHHTGYVSCCRFIGDTKMLTSSGDSTCIQWDIESSKPTTIFEGHDADVMCLATASENLFISGSVDQTAKVWDTRTQKCVQTYFGYHTHDINSVEVFPDGNGFFTGSEDGQAILFDMRCWSPISIFGDKMPITSIGASASGRLLFTGQDETAKSYEAAKCGFRVWDVVTGKRIASLEGHDKRISCLGVNRSSTAIATGSWDDMLMIWA